MQDGRAATFLGDSKERHAEACSMHQEELRQIAVTLLTSLAGDALAAQA
jgi:hypothetical protein